MTDPVTVREVPGGYLVEATLEPGGGPCCGPFHTRRETAEDEARRKLPLVRWYRGRNERSGVARVGWWEMADPLNLPTGWCLAQGVVLREPAKRGDYVWCENVAGLVSAGMGEG